MLLSPGSGRLRQIEFRVLGSLEVTDQGKQLPLPAQKPRGLLVLLLVRANEVVRAEALIEELWAGSPPESASKLLQGYVSRLRKLLGPGRGDGTSQLLLTRAGGYSLQVEPEQLDTLQFERLLSEGQKLLAEDPEAAASTLRRALSLWRGPALADFRYEQFAQQEINRLEELRLVALEARIEAELALGRHQHLVAELEGLIAEQPLRERLRGQLMLALYRSGRQAEALAAFKQTRGVLIDELGIEPSRQLQRLEQEILRQASALEAPLVEQDRVTPAASEALGQLPTGTVSFLFTDIDGSTRLVQRLGDRYGDLLATHAELLRSAFAAAGGREVDTQGDSFLVAFARAGDALAGALGAQRALLSHPWSQGAKPQVRMGIHSGEPQLGKERYVGLDLHRGARICALARGGQVLLSQTTRELVADELPEGVSLRDLGERLLKDIERPERIFQLVAPDLLDSVVPAASGFVLSSGPRLEPVGREQELKCVDALLERLGAAQQALLLEGEAGIGKTTIFEEAIARAHECAAIVLFSRPTGGELQLAFAGLADLLQPVLGEVLRQLPTVQRRALEVTLLYAEGPAPDERLLATALAGALAGLAARAPLVLAIDDLQWLDKESCRSLEFALRRLQAPYTLLAAVRGRSGAALPLALERTVVEVERVAVVPLSFAATHRLLRDRLDLRLTKPILDRVHGISGGNPMYALELGRAIAIAGPAAPLPESLRALVSERLARLPSSTQELLVTAAALAHPREELLLQTTGDAEQAERDLELAEREGVLAASAQGVEFSHPLLRAAAYEDAPLRRRRRIHRRLAALVTDVEERARHLALAADEPSEAVAALVEEAAESAGARGAYAAAAELAQQAIRLTPSEPPEKLTGRQLTAARHLVAAGADAEARTLLESLLIELPPGSERARALVALAVVQDEVPEAMRLCVQALAEADDDWVRADAHALAASAAFNLSDLTAVFVNSAAGVETAERSGNLSALVHASSMGAAAAFVQTGRADLPPLQRAAALELAGAVPMGVDWDGAAAVVLGWSYMFEDRLEEGREWLEKAHTALSATGIERARAPALMHLSELETRAGNFALALEYALEGIELLDLAGFGFDQTPSLLYAKAFAAAHLGEVETARAAAELGSARSEAIGDWLFRIQNQSLLGFLELSIGDAAAAARRLLPLAGIMREIGQDQQPSVYLVHGNAIEALVTTGDLVHARELLVLLEERAQAVETPWLLATSARCHGLLEAAEGDLEQALESLERALCCHERLPMPFERGRTLLVKGTLLRQAKRKREALTAVEQALAIFEQLGTPLWAEKARAERSRSAGRAPAELV